MHLNLIEVLDVRDANSIEEIAYKSQEFSFQASEVSEDSISKNQSIELNDLSMQEKQIIKRKAVPFFRIWFGLNKQEIGKSAIGSFAAALSGISKPLFGFFIMTIGVAYYKPDAKRQVGLYSVIFCAVGLVALVTHTLQHYFYGMVGEKAMTNLRQALYSGIIFPSFLFSCIHASCSVSLMSYEFDG